MARVACGGAIEAGTGKRGCSNSLSICSRYDKSVRASNKTISVDPVVLHTCSSQKFKKLSHSARDHLRQATELQSRIQFPLTSNHVFISDMHSTRFSHDRSSYLDHLRIFLTVQQLGPYHPLIKMKHTLHTGYPVAVFPAFSLE